MNDHDLARLLSLSRVAVGIAALVAPRRVMGMWTGEGASSRTALVATRGLAGRDLALGVGALVALENGEGADKWLQAGALADVTDAFSTLNAPGLPRWRRLLFLVVTGGATALGLRLARSLA